MAGRIKGITIEIDGETSGLENALSGITKKSIDIQKELKDVERLLKFDPGNTEALAQKQKLLQAQLQNTAEKLKALKEAEKQVEEQFQKGDLNENQYRSFRREIQFTEKEINNLDTKLKSLGDGVSLAPINKDFEKVKKSAKDAEGSVKEFGDELTNIIAGAAAGAGLDKVIEKSLDVTSKQTKIDISMELDPQSVDIVKNSISTIEAYGVDSETALEGVRRQWALNKDASDESNAAVVQGAAAIVASYGEVDFTELIQEGSELSKNLQISNEDAMGLIYSLLKVGFPPDQLDIITEYGSQLKNAGYNAEEIQGIMAAGVKTGTWNIDVLLDGLKEGRIRLAEFGQGIDKTTTQLLQGTGISAEQLQKWGQQVAQGGETGKKAMQDVAAAVAGVDDKTKQNQLGVAIYGTLWEENGTKITDTILGMSNNMMTAEANQNNLKGAIETLDADPMVKLQKAVSDLVTALTPLLSIVADLISKFAEWVSNNPTLAATIIAIVSALGIFIGLVAGIAPIITMLVAIFPELAAVIAALAAPVSIIVAIIAALIAAGIALYMNWDKIKVVAAEVWAAIVSGISSFVDALINFFTVTVPETIDSMVAFFLELPGKIAYALGFALAKVVQWGINMASYLQTNVPIWINNVVTFFSELPGRIWTWLVNTVNKVVEWGSNMLSVAKSEAGKVINGIVDAFVNLPSRMWDVGMNAVEGLKNGFLNAWEGIKGWVGGLMNKFTQGAEDALKEGSPSKVMMKIGAYAGEGFAIGVKSTLGLVASQAQALADAAMPIPAVATPSTTSNVYDSAASDTVMYAKITVPLDGRIIAEKTTPIVVQNISRGQLNYNIAKGRG